MIVIDEIESKKETGAPSPGTIERVQAPLEAWLVVEQEQAEAFAILSSTPGTSLRLRLAHCPPISAAA